LRSSADLLYIRRMISRLWLGACFAAISIASAAEPVVEDITVGSRKAYLVKPGGAYQNAAAILFVHWYEPESPDSNRTQYLRQAIELAREGVVSLLPETMWSEPKWFPMRNLERDYEVSVEQAAELHKALDFLLAQPGIDRKRVAYVGHDFGMMYGLLLSKDDKRPTAWALQAGTAGFEDWFLYGRQRLPELEKQKVRDRLAPIAPHAFIGELGAPVLLQFGTKDFHVPPARASLLVEKAKSPKMVLYYDAGHGLNDEAVRDRMAWLRTMLSLK
jgi:dienelactone hydrolase